MDTDQIVALAKTLFASECERRGVVVAEGVRANWGIMLLGKGEPYICDYKIGPKRHGQKLQAHLFEARYTRDGTLVDFRFPEGTDNKYFVPRAPSPDSQ